VIRLLKLVTSIVVCQLAGFIGSLFVATNIGTWYTHIRKPFFTPPNWVFGPVWFVLYLLMGIAVYLVWSKGWYERGVKRSMVAFGQQLLLNVLWAVMFFGSRSPFMGLVVIGFLWLAIFYTMENFLKVSTNAGLLLLPYLLWVTFAAFLNLSILVMNA
jgi:benzodiazapine receptor